MTARERFLTALDRRIPDRVPMFDFLLQESLFERLIGHKDEWGSVFVRSEVSWPIDSPIRYPISCREDFGDSISVLFNKDLDIKHFYPYFKDLVDYVDSLGVPALLHSCGCIYEYLDLMAATKIKSIHPVQREGMKAGTAIYAKG
ncbi:MAG: hypothetical protein WCQ50_02370 [Spirochaetota bacterium]